MLETMTRHLTGRQIIISPIWSSNVYLRIYENPSLDPVLRYSNSRRTFTSYVFDIHLVLSSLYTDVSLIVFRSGFPTKIVCAMFNVRAPVEAT